jgi:hypothetical protein
VLDMGWKISSILMSFFYWQGSFSTDSQPRHSGIDLDAALSGSHSFRQGRVLMEIEAIISSSFDQISARKIDSFIGKIKKFF